MSSNQEHWDNVYQANEVDRVGWYQSNPAVSLQLLRGCSPDLAAPVIDVGGGASLLADRLLDEGRTDITVLDLSSTALAFARNRLESRSDQVFWIQGDVTAYELGRSYQIWHDRAVFHFLTEEAEQARYVEQLMRWVADGGDVIIATFALDGPERCSGLPVKRYGRTSLAQRLGSGFQPVAFEREIHRTPAGVEQRFLFAHFRKVSGSTQ